MSLKRIHVDRKEVFLEGRMQGIAVRLVDPENPYHLRGSIRGPKDSPYFGGLFELDIHIPADYAFKPPTISFLTEVYHPFVSARGMIGLVSRRHDAPIVVRPFAATHVYRVML
jgi:ubiquitin-protein ligase